MCKLYVKSKLFRKNLTKNYMGTLLSASNLGIKLNSTAKNAVDLLMTSWTPCMQTSVLTIDATESWLTVSVNQRHLLIAKLLQATSTVGWGWHLFVTVYCQLQLLRAMYTKSKWLFSKHNKKLFSFIFVFILESSPDGALHLDVSQPRRRWIGQPKTFAKDVDEDVTSPIPLPLMKNCNYTWAI